MTPVAGPTRPRSAIFALATAAVLVLTGCGGGSETDQRGAGRGPDQRAEPSRSTEPARTPSPTATDEAPETPAEVGTVVKAAGSQFGDVLFDRGGQAIYFFDKERTSTPECYGDCAEAWPPVLTDGQPAASGAIRADLLGTTKRRDGTTQVTYDGRPLYTYAHEGKDVVLCHDVDEFGGLWLAVLPDGKPAPH